MDATPPIRPQEAYLPLPTPSTLDPALEDRSPGYRPFLELYPRVLKTVKPKNLKTIGELEKLDEFRYVELPRDIRTTAKLGAYVISSKDLSRLMQWKLARGSWRPKLQALVESNVPIFVDEITRLALEEFSKGDSKNHRKAMEQLARLKGVGPATASLALSTAFPDELPFFADELLAWLRGWTSRKQGQMRYNLKEYDEIVTSAKPLIEKIAAQNKNNQTGSSPEHAASVIEKTAWVVLKLQEPGTWKEIFGTEMPTPSKQHDVGAKKLDKSTKTKQVPKTPQPQPTGDRVELKKDSSTAPSKRKTTQKDATETAASKRPRRR